MKRIITWAVIAPLLITGCANTDKVLRPERTTFIKQSTEAQAVTLMKQLGREHQVKLQCLAWDGDKPRDMGDTQCLYYSIDEQEIFSSFSDSHSKELRNIYLSFLLNISDQNCSTFLGRAFANKASFDTGKGLVQDVLTGSSAASATAVPQAAAGLGLVNLLVGKGVDNINSTFYFEKTFQALAAAIKVERDAVRKDEIEPIRHADYDAMTIYDALARVRKYDDTCSIRVGLAKLQELAQDVKHQNGLMDARNKELAEKSLQLLALQTKLDALTLPMLDATKDLESSNKQIQQLASKLQSSENKGKQTSDIKSKLNDELEKRKLYEQKIRDFNDQFKKVRPTLDELGSNPPAIAKPKDVAVR